MTLSQLRFACLVVALFALTMMWDGAVSVYNGYMLGMANITVGVAIYAFLIYLSFPNVKFFWASKKQAKK